MASSRPSNSPIFIAIIGVAVLGLIGINVFGQRISPEYQKHQEEEQQRKAEEAAAKAAQGKEGKQEKQDPRLMNPGIVAGNMNDLATFGEEKILGSVTSEEEVTIGWEWTPEVQANPALLQDAIQAAQKVAPDARIRVVNLDAATDETVPAGVSVQKQVIAPLGPDGSLSADAVQKALAEKLHTPTPPATPTK